MNHVNVDVIGLKASERILDLVEDGCAREPPLVNVVALVFKFRTEKAGDGVHIVVIDEEACLRDNDHISAWDVVLRTKPMSTRRSTKGSTYLFHEVPDNLL